MNFLAMLIALALQQVVSPDSVLQSRTWVLSWSGIVGRYLKSEIWCLLVAVLSVALAGAWLLGAVEGWVFGLPSLAASAAMLLWSVGHDDYHTALERYDAKREIDPDAALECLDSLWMPPRMPPKSTLATPGSLDEAASATAAEPEELAHHHLLYAGYARWFAPVLFFVIGGPVAAVAYRCVAILAAQAPRRATLRILALLDWVPSRLLVATFAVTGNFLEVLERLRREHLWFGASASDLLGAAARSACSNAPGPRVGADLLYRSAGFWLLMLSILYLFT